MKNLAAFSVILTALCAFADDPFGSPQEAQNDDPFASGVKVASANFRTDKPSFKAVIHGEDSFDIGLYNNPPSKSHCVNFENLRSVLWKMRDREHLHFDAAYKCKVDEDRFKICIAPRIMGMGYARLTLDARLFKYDSDEDPFAQEIMYWREKRGDDDVSARINRENAEKKKKMEEIISKYGDENGTLSHPAIRKFSIEKLKKIADGGDEEARLIYAKVCLSPQNIKAAAEDMPALAPEDGMRIMRELAETGNVEAMQTLVKIYSGNFYNSEAGTELDKFFSGFKNPELALKYKFLSAEKGDSLYLRDCVKHLVDEGNFSEAEALLAKFPDATWQADALLCAYFGYPLDKLISTGCMCYGRHFVPDFGDLRKPAGPAKAFEWASKYAKTPYGDDALLLAHCHLYGIGCGKDLKKAFDAAEKSSMPLTWISRSLPAYAYLAYAYANGIGVEADKRKSELYWELFYEPLPQDHDSAQAVVDTARRFYNGWTVPQDKRTAVEILEKASERYASERAQGKWDSTGVSFSGTLCKIYSGEFDPADKSEERLAHHKKILADCETYANAEKERRAKENK